MQTSPILFLGNIEQKYHKPHIFLSGKGVDFYHIKHVTETELPFTGTVLSSTWVYG